MKRISAGCRAVIVNRLPEDNGRVVKVVRYLGDMSKVISPAGIAWDGCRWEIDEEVTTFLNSPCNSVTGKAHHVCENDLQRIDDDQQELGSWDQIEADCGYSPNREVVV